MKTKTAACVLLLAFLFSGAVHGQESSSAPMITVQPERIDIDAFYRGTTLEIEGTGPVCDNLVLLVRGPDEEAVFNRKGKVVVLWMNVAKVTVKNVPKAYILVTADSSRRSVDDAVADSLGLGYEALKKQVVIDSDEPLIGNEFEDYVQLKESKELYQIQRGKITLKPAGEGRIRFSTTCFLPPTTLPGEYSVIAYFFSDGHLVDGVTDELAIAKTGMPKFITDLAFQHPALYGVVAILVAMAAGMLMGILFNRKSKGAH